MRRIIYNEKKGNEKWGFYSILVEVENYSRNCFILYQEINSDIRKIVYNLENVSWKSLIYFSLESKKK